MFWHKRVYKTGLTVTRNAVTKFELPANVPIGSIWLKLVAQVEAANPMAALAKWRLVDYVDSIDIIANGSTIVKSLPGTVLSALNVYDQGSFPGHQEREYSQPYVRNNYLINLGRYFRDRGMYIPANYYDSLDLEIDFSGTSTYFQSDPTLDIVIEQPEGSGVPGSIGFMRTEVWREWTTVSDEWKYLTLPTQYDIRRILVQAWPDLDADELEETNITNIAKDIKLTLKNGTVEVFENGFDTLMKHESQCYGGPFQAHGHIYHTADKGWYSGLGYVINQQIAPATKDGAVAGTVPTIEADRNTGTQKMETYAADEPVPFLVTGFAPFHCVRIPFDDDLDPSTWLNPSAEGDVDLNIHTRSGATYADGTIKVILDRKVPI